MEKESPPKWGGNPTKPRFPNRLWAPNPKNKGNPLPGKHPQK